MPSAAGNNNNNNNSTNNNNNQQNTQNANNANSINANSGEFVTCWPITSAASTYFLSQLIILHRRCCLLLDSQLAQQRNRRPAISPTTAPTPRPPVQLPRRDQIIKINKVSYQDQDSPSCLFQSAFQWIDHVAWSYDDLQVRSSICHKHNTIKILRQLETA